MRLSKYDLDFVVVLCFRWSIASVLCIRSSCRTLGDCPNGVGSYLVVNPDAPFLLLTNITLGSGSFTVGAFLRRSNIDLTTETFLYQPPDGSSLDHSCSFYATTITCSYYGEIVSGPLPTVDRQWHHVAVTYNSVAFEFAIYFDGQRIGSDILWRLFHHPPIITNMGFLHLGSPSGLPFGGAIDNFRLYRRALTVDDVALLPSGRSRSCMDLDIQLDFEFENPTTGGLWDSSGQRYFEHNEHHIASCSMRHHPLSPGRLSILLFVCRLVCCELRQRLL